MTTSRHPVAGVYVGLDDLARLQYQASGFSFLPRQPLSSLLAGRHGANVRGRGLNFEEIRAYRPGDDIRTIDWKVSNRMQKPHSRVFTEERDRPALLVVDQRQSMFYGTRKNMKSVTAAETAAIAAWRVFSQGDRVGGFVFNDESMSEVSPHRSRDRVMRLLQHVVDMNHQLAADAPAVRGTAQLNKVLRRVERLARHDHLIVVISDFDGADESTRKSLMRLKRHNDVICALVHDPSALDELPALRMVASDGHHQAELDFANRKVRDAVHSLSANRISQVLEWQRSFRVPMLPLSTDDDVVDQVRRHLGGGAK